MLVHFKKATEDDIPALLEIERTIVDTHLYSQMLTTEEWEDELRKNTIYLLEKDGEMIGYVAYELKNADHAYISGLAVSHRFQGQGIAREALVHILEKLKGIKRIDLVTHPDNAVARHLYESLGFFLESEKENYFGDGQPRVVLALIRNQS